MHVKLLIVPLHVPLRYWLPPHIQLSHCKHVKPLVVPLHVPLRYSLVPHD